jgi:hypothetical protein
LINRAHALVTALLAVVAASCASAEPPAFWQNGDIRGDFDGDGRQDIAVFEETPDGVLSVIVRRAAAPDQPISIWGGDIASAPYFAISAAPPGTYHTMCHLYDSCGTTIPEQVTLAHDGIIVHALEGPAEFYYYWDGAAFRDILISE